jgi:hypothetical protein
MEMKSECVETRIAGVSFLVEAVQHVKQGDAVALVKEPSNEYDSNAVKVVSLSGKLLGYVPRGVNEKFTLHHVFGRVAYVGRDESKLDSLIGIKVSSYPLLMSPCVSPVPAQREAMLKEDLGPDVWSRLCSDAIKGSFGLCQFTAAPPAKDYELELKPVWKIEGLDITLVKLALVSKDVASAHRLLDLDVDSEEYKQGCMALMLINRWNQDHLNAHIEAMKQIRDSLIARTSRVILD